MNQTKDATNTKDFQFNTWEQFLQGQQSRFLPWPQDDYTAEVLTAWEI